MFHVSFVFGVVLIGIYCDSSPFVIVMGSNFEKIINGKKRISSRALKLFFKFFLFVKTWINTKKKKIKVKMNAEKKIAYGTEFQNNKSLLSLVCNNT